MYIKRESERTTIRFSGGGGSDPDETFSIEIAEEERFKRWKNESEEEVVKA